MEKDNGYIALYRRFLNWEWYDDANTMRLFIHCLLSANYKDKNWRGKTIGRGQFITSQPKLAHSLKLSIMQIRNSLTKLKTTGEITVFTTADYSVITVKNYDFYQCNNRLDNSLSFENQQSSNSLITTTNKDNKENNKLVVVVEENFEKLYGEYLNVHLTKKQYDKLLAMCTSLNFLNEILNAFSVNIEVGKEQPYKADLPNAHYERLKSYYNYRRKHPEIFNETNKQDVWDKLAEKYKDLKV